MVNAIPSGLNIKVGTTGGTNNDGWRQPSTMYINLSGTWTSIKKGYINVSGTWQQFYGAGVPPTIIYLSNPVVTRDSASTYKYNVSTGSWNGFPISYSYQWYYYRSIPVNPFYEFTTISGATSSSYTSSSSYVGYDIYCIVTATNADGSGTATSNFLTITTAAARVTPGTPTSPINTYVNYSGGVYNYTCTWTAPSTGTTPISYYLQVFGQSAYASGTGSGGSYVGTIGPNGSLNNYTGTSGGGFTGTSGSYSSSYAYNYFQVYGVNYDGTNYYPGPNSTSSQWK